MTAQSIWAAIDERLAAGQRLWIVAVVAHTRGSPGTTGAVLYVADNGDVGGTIGGGGMEKRLIADGHAALGAPAYGPRWRREVHRADAGEVASGLICAGEQCNVMFVVEPERDGAAIRAFGRALVTGETGVLTITTDAPVVFVAGEATPTGVWPATDRACARVTISSRQTRRLVVFGGGHCGRQLASLATDIGYHVTVHDRRGEVLSDAGWPAGVARRQLPETGIPDIVTRDATGAFAVVMNDNVLADVAVLAAVANLPWRWLGVMGSRHKIHVIRSKLGEASVADETIARIVGPIGLPMKSDTPAEIAVSVMGQLLQIEGRAR
ncbi:XdhC family protein [Salinisphaera sp. Q1T1-3]|uniref:XdhC family protein n=1 Tax=Salinisphaera sp. Q1T1-3 TaxID=2321229 RepID=UPI000E71BD79|nr:XdhC family protein [Salinisphaera sp. Q1T1-3]RJS93803.1 hypothetical protein D3260_07005 [Salinisphaera sp. Q1T1-3]